MSFLNEHRIKQQKKVPIAKASLQKGMIVTCRYTNREGTSSDNMLLILNPGHKGKIHALSLANFSSKKFNDLAEKVGITNIFKYRVRGLNIPKLRMNVSSNSFYKGFLSKVKVEYNDAYRTYFEGKIGAIQLVDYNFDKGIITE